MSAKKINLYTGIVMFIGLALFLASVAWLSGRNIFFKSSYEIGFTFPDIVGIRDGSAVYLRGYKIGSIESVDISREKVTVLAEIGKGVRIPADSRAEIRTLNFIGEKAVSIIPGRSEKYLAEGGTLEGENKDLTVLAMNILEDLSRKVRDGDLDKEIKNLSGVFADVRALVARLESMASGIDTAGINREIAEWGETGREVRRFLGSAGEDLARFVNEGGETMDMLRAGADEIGAAVRQVKGLAADVRQGKGTLGALATDEEYLRRLSRTLEELEAFLADIRAHPKKYVKFSIF